MANSAAENKYRILLARNRDLEEQLRKKNEQWEKRDEAFRITEKNTRSLCEMILATDPDEMRLGKNKSWSETPINVLLNNAVNALNKYQKTFQRQLSELMDDLESRREENEELRGQLIDEKRKNNLLLESGSSLSRKDVDKLIKDAKKQVVDDAFKKANKINSESAKILDDDEDDENEVEGELKDSAANQNASYPTKPTDFSIPHVKNEKAVKKDDERRNAAQINQQDLSGIESDLTDIHYLIIKTLGDTGMSIYTEIKDKILTENPTITDSALRTATGVLVNKTILSKNKINIWAGKRDVIMLRVFGKRIYLDKYGKPPAEAEGEKLKREHSSLEHGYGIKFVADTIVASGEFKEVIYETRKMPMPTKTESGKDRKASNYIPDIICRTQNGREMYIEYETVKATQTYINQKLSKALSIVSDLYFVCPNAELSEKMAEQIKKWIQGRGAKTLYGFKVRVTSAKSLTNGNILKDSTWRYMFNPSKNGMEPTVNY